MAYWIPLSHWVSSPANYVHVYITCMLYVGGIIIVFRGTITTSVHSLFLVIGLLEEAFSTV